MAKELKYAPREVFEQILEYAVIPTFDLVIELSDARVVLVRRKIEPYANQWALPGLRMMKPESIEDTLIRIAMQEVGLLIDPRNRRFLGQYVGRFRTEHNRQDISTGYAVSTDANEIQLNDSHFTDYRLISRADEIPTKIGGMYKFYLENYFGLGNK